MQGPIAPPGAHGAVLERVHAADGEEAGADRHQHVGAQARGMFAALALVADDATEKRRREKSRGLLEDLPKGRLAEEIGHGILPAVATPRRAPDMGSR